MVTSQTHFNQTSLNVTPRTITKVILGTASQSKRRPKIKWSFMATKLDTLNMKFDFTAGMKY